MSTKWSYSGDPSASQKDAVRFRIGDTESKDPLLTDAEIDYLVATEGSTNEASIAGARAVLAKLTREVSTTEGKASKELQQRVEHYQNLVTQLIGQRGKRVTGIFAGGMTISGKASVTSDSDRVKPAFTRDMHESPSVSPGIDEETV